MKKRRFEFRLIPVVVLASLGLLALKSMGIVFDGGYTLGQRLGGDRLVVTTVPANTPTQLRFETTPLQVASAQPAERKTSWMKQMFNYPDGSDSASDSNIVTGSVSAPKPAPAKEAAKPAEPQAGKPDTKPAAAPAAQAQAEPQRPVSAAERSILELLQKRRQELDARARELEMRESLVKAAEQKIESQPSGAKAATEARASAAKSKEDVEVARFKGLVTMYETMKPKDAAKIFDRLDMKVLIEMSSQINPRKMSEILAQMSPEAAEKLTVELATRATGGDKTTNPNDLPKIDGKPGAM